MNVDPFASIITLIAALLVLYRRKIKVRQHDSLLTGNLYCQELLTTPNEARFRNALRMEKETFLSLILNLKSKGLKHSRYISAEEKGMIFIHVIVGFSIRQCSERWQHSSESIHKVIYEVADVLLKFQNNWFQKPDGQDNVPDRIKKSGKFFPFFKNCIGALDGSHIPAVAPPTMQGPFRNRKGYNSQNVLVVCNFDLTVSFLLAGWEGSVHDGKVYNDAVGKGLPTFQGKYYLGDAGYALTYNTLTPYRGVRYHLKEWSKGDLKPRTKEELFNLRHASLRNVIERLFGVVKKRFPILCKMPSFPYSFQIKLVKCCFLLHNFITMGEQNISEEFNVTEQEAAEATDVTYDDRTIANMRASSQLNAWRDSIAQAMWESYLEYCYHNSL
jgi:hypothetical protein